MKKYGTAILTFLGVALIITVFSTIDYGRFQNDKEPIFAYPIYYNDGGSVEYIGLGYEIIYFNMLEDRFLEEENFKYFGPFWVTFDKAYIKTVGEFYASLSPEEKEFYAYFEDIIYNDEFEVIFGAKESSIYEYYYKLIDLYQTDERLNDDHRNYIYNLVAEYYDKSSKEMDENIKNIFEKFVTGRDFSPVVK
ncbi:MAG: hypothetical protein IKJ36_00410 [Clostridia bacterium]|nr:hypothetical protein [Clostridia bacterium]